MCVGGKKVFALLHPNQRESWPNMTSFPQNAQNILIVFFLLNPINLSSQINKFWHFWFRIFQNRLPSVRYEHLWECLQYIFPRKKCCEYIKTVCLVIDNHYMLNQLHFLPNEMYIYRIKRTIFIVCIHYTSFLNVAMGRLILHFEYLKSWRVNVTCLLRGCNRTYIRRMYLYELHRFVLFPAFL